MEKNHTIKKPDAIEGNYGQKKRLLRPDSQETIQQAIDICYDQGGGQVVLTAGTYISGTIQLKSNVTLILEQGALLLGSNDSKDYPENETCFVDAVGHKRGRAFLYAYQAENIGITGEGMIDGRGGEFPPEHPDHLIRPFLVRLVECRNVMVEGVALRQSAAWCLHIQDSSLVSVKGISIMNRCNGNNDGIDIDGCGQVEIEDCSIDAGDDALCLKSTSRRACQDIRIRNCRVTTNWAAFKIGTESAGDFQNIEVGNCVFYDVKGCGIKVVPVDGGHVEHLYLHDITMLNCTGPVFFSTGERLRTYFGVGREEPGQIRHVVLERIRARTVSAKGGFYRGKPWGNARGCVVFSGLEGKPIEDIVIRDCCFDMPGGVLERPAGEVPLIGKEYPEFHLFDILPCWGMYLRHVRGLRLKGITMTRRNEDVRPMMAKEDAEDVSEG